MHCPLCREEVSDENQLQVHYLMSCSGYVEDASINKAPQVSRSNPSAVVQFRWVKSKPTLAREVYLISSLAGSISLTWSEVEECFLSQPTNVPSGVHSCQLVVDSDPMSTKDFEISDQSKIVNITISEASLTEGSTSGGNISSRESLNVHPLPVADASRHIRRTRESSVERRTTQTSERPSQKSTLYQELVTHQIMHGDSFDEFADNVKPNEGRRLGSARARANGLAHITNDSRDFQQFLRPSVTNDDQQDPAVNEDSEEDENSFNRPENGEANEERTSSPSVADSADISQSLSSHEELEMRTRPVLLGSDVRNSDQEGSAHEHTPALNGDDNQEESPGSFVHVENRDSRDHEESVADGQENSLDGHEHEEEQDGYEVPDGDNQEDVPDGHDEQPGDHEEEPGHHNSEEVPHDDDDEEVPHDDNNEEVPHDDNNEEVPHDDNNEEVPHDDNNEEVPHGDDREEVPHGDGHEVTPEDHNKEETLNPNDRRALAGDHEQVPNPVTQRETPILDPHAEQPEVPFPVLDARSHESFGDDNQVLVQQKERQPIRGGGGSGVTRPSSAPTFIGREPEGGNEDMTRSHRSGYGSIPLIPSASSTSDATRQSSDQAGAWVPGTGGSFQRGGRNAFLDHSHVDMLVRHSPAGSVFGDQEIRRPPLYTSAPSRPLSSPPYPTQDRPVISPLVSPHISNRAVTSTTRYRPSGGAVNENDTPRSERNPTTSLDGLLNRETPMGSAYTVSSSSVVSSSYRTSTAELWSDEKIKELLNSLKQTPKRTNGHSAENLASLRERHQNSEMTALKTELTEREEHVKKLKTRNTVYEKEILKLRAKELELAKALSLAESSRAAAKEQEDIVRQLTHALNMKEKECSGLEKKVLDIKQTQRLLENEAESRKKVNEIRVQELRSVNKSLSDEVKTLRHDSIQYNSVNMNRFKKLQEDILESRAVNNSLQDQVKLLEKENAELQRKLRRMSTEMENLKASATSTTSAYEKKYANYSPTANEAVKNSRALGDHESRSTAVNGYLGTSESSKFIARHQSNGETKTSHQSTTVPGNYDFPWGSRNGQSKVTGYSSKAARSYHNDVHVERHDGGTSPRSRFELESFPNSASGWRRKGSSGDVVSSEDSSYIGVGRYTRSYSSDSITTSSLLQNGLSAENSHSHDRAKVRDRYGQDVGEEYRRRERRRRERPHSYHSGSHENLAAPSSPAWSSPQTSPRQFSVRGHRLDTSPTSPDTSEVSQPAKTPSPKRGKPFAPSTPQEIDQGMTVLVTRACGNIGKGKVKFVGCLPTRKDMVYLGLELEREEGKHDGEFHGQRFFKCKRNHGIFVPFSKVVMAYT